MNYVQLGKLHLPLEKSYTFKAKPTISQDDYTNAILSVYVPPPQREALSHIIVSEGEHQLDKWEVENKGAYTGAWSKRFAKYVYKAHNVKLDPRVVSIISERVMKALQGMQLNVLFQFSTELWNPGEFGEKENSCWFPGRAYGYSASALMDSEQGGAIKIYTDKGFKRGRCWFYNVDDSILIFNAYDIEKKLDILSIARMVSSHFGMQYMKHLNVIIDKSYLNGNAIYAIGDPPIKRPVTMDFALRASTPAPSFSRDMEFYIPGNLTCSLCSSDRDVIQWNDGRYYCRLHRVICAICDTRTPLPYIHDQDDCEGWMCDTCRSSKGLALCDDCECVIMGEECQQCNSDRECEICETHLHGDDGFPYEGSEDRYICESCYDGYGFRCANCDSIYHTDNGTYISAQDYTVCDDCYNERYDKCHYCDRTDSSENFSTIHDETICESCSNERCYQCDHCGELEWTTDTSDVEHDGVTETWCDSCRDSDATYCEGCELYHADTDHHECEEEEETP